MVGFPGKDVGETRPTRCRIVLSLSKSRSRCKRKINVQHGLEAAYGWSLQACGYDNGLSANRAPPPPRSLSSHPCYVMRILPSNLVPASPSCTPSTLRPYPLYIGTYPGMHAPPCNGTVLHTYTITTWYSCRRQGTRLDFCPRSTVHDPQTRCSPPNIDNDNIDNAQCCPDEVAPSHPPTTVRPTAPWRAHSISSHGFPLQAHSPSHRREW